MKLVFMLITLALPVYLHGYVFYFPYWILMLLTLNHFFIWFIMTNHWTVQNKHIDQDNVMDEHWAVNQCQVSTNFGVDGRMWLYLTGGLNFHREHHLIPNYCHANYFVISKILRKHCKEHSVPYNYYTGFYGALKGFFQFMIKMGSED